MNFIVPNAPAVKVITEHGIGRRVFLNGNEIPFVRRVDVEYGIDDLPEVNISFLAKVEISEGDVSK